MPKFPHPPPPDELRRLPAELRTARAGTLVARIYPRGGPHPTTWRQFRFDGPLPSARFDPQVANERRGVLYAAGDLVTCVAEVFQGSRLVDRVTAEVFLAGFRLTRSVRLLDLTGDWPTRAGASQALASGPRPRAQAWARTIYLRGLSEDRRDLVPVVDARRKSGSRALRARGNGTPNNP